MKSFDTPIAAIAPYHGGAIDPFDGRLLAFPLVDADFNQFQVQTQSIVIGWALKILGNRADAEDLAQETYVRLFLAVRRQALKNTDNVRGFCYCILRNHAFHMSKKRNQMPTAESMGEDGNFTNSVDEIAIAKPLEVEIAQREWKAALHRSVAALPPMLRGITIGLLNGDDLTLIASYLGVDYSTAKMRSFRARKMLIDKLRAAGIEDTSGILW